MKYNWVKTLYYHLKPLEVLHNYVVDPSFQTFYSVRLRKNVKIDDCVFTLALFLHNRIAAVSTVRTFQELFLWFLHFMLCCLLFCGFTFMSYTCRWSQSEHVLPLATNDPLQNKYHYNCFVEFCFTKYLHELQLSVIWLYAGYFDYNLCI